MHHMVHGHILSTLCVKRTKNVIQFLQLCPINMVKYSIFFVDKGTLLLKRYKHYTGLSITKMHTTENGELMSA
jgi:hypothetical protein